MHRLIVKPSAERALLRLPREAQRRIIAKFEELTRNPRPPGVVTLSGDENLWRVRVGVYRIVYEILDRELIIHVLAIGHRREVHR